MTPRPWGMVAQGVQVAVALPALAQLFPSLSPCPFRMQQ